MSMISIGMAFTRDRWISKFSNTFKGALGEYAKLKYAKAIGMDDYWSDEIQTLMNTVKNLFRPNIIKTKTKFNLYKAGAEAFLEIMDEQIQIIDAKNEFLRSYLNSTEEKIKFQKIVKKLKLTSEDLAFELLENYLPEYQTEIIKELQLHF